MVSYGEISYRTKLSKGHSMLSQSRLRLWNRSQSGLRFLSSNIRPSRNTDNEELGMELELALNLSNEINKSGEKERLDLKVGEDLLDGEGLAPSSGSPRYAKEMNQVLKGDRAPSRNRGHHVVNSVEKAAQRRKAPAKRSRSDFQIQSSSVSFEPIAIPNDDATKPPRLCHELERVLFQPMNFHNLQDARSGTYNFSKWLEDIIKVEDFDFEAVSEFVTASKDEIMLNLAHENKKRYYSSTSSMTGVLSHLHFLMSNFRKTNMSLISKHFSERSANFTWGAQLPAVVIMKRMDQKKGIFSIDSDKSSDREIILSLLGHALETILTTEETQFKQVYDKSSGSYRSVRVRPAGKYHYSKIEDFILRSQLDAYNDKLPGTGVFDLKTRAVAAVRHDIAYVEENDNYTGYQIQKTLGQFESYERELFELIRSTMLKYSLQARIGRMDGIFVAYHNISKIFGFQYMPIEEMDHILHSYGCSSFNNILNERNDAFRAILGEEAFILKHDQANFSREITSRIADCEFKISMSVFDRLLKLVERELPANFHACRLIVKAERKRVTDDKGDCRKLPVLNVLVAPLTKEQTDSFQNTDLRKEYLQDGANINHYIHKVRQLNSVTAQNVIGFEVLVDHEAQHHPNTIPYPRFADKKSKVLNKEEKDFVKKVTQHNYYNDLSAWKHIQFFHPLDVLKWKPKFTVHRMTDDQKLKRLYMTYLDEKLSALEGQSVAKKSSKPSQAMICDRIRKFRAGGESSSEQSSSDDQTDVSQLQLVLRAYSKKGDLLSKRHKT